MSQVAQFEVYDAYVLFGDYANGKERPIVVASVQDFDEYFTGHAIYSKTSWWEKYPEIYDLLYQIQDYEYAGLQYDSYLDLSSLDAYGKERYFSITPRGRLSDRDILGVLEASIRFEELYEKESVDNPTRILEYRALYEYSLDFGTTPGNHSQ
ncbi:MAG: hypothetical protein LBC43_04935 [Bifidobacteriaceae bacterium]|jgi:hypothetical protein|nr:hypothetical protein [Bifidobacteriaceae bacterium]